MPIAILFLIIVLLIIAFSAAIYFYEKIIKVQEKNVIELPQKCDSGFFGRMRQTGNLEDVYMFSRDGLMLHGIIKRADPQNWVIICHGYTQGATSMTDFADMFDRMGYSTLTIDLRGHGESKGTYIGMGWHDSADCVDWANWLSTRQEGGISIILFGISMGAATVMLTQSRKHDESIKCIIEDSGYSSIKAEFKHNMKKLYHLPGFPLLNALSCITKLRTGYSLTKDGDCVAAVKHSHVPILFIHGEADDFVPFKMVKKLYKACSSEKEIFTVKDADHGQSHDMDKDGYEAAISKFLHRVMDDKKG